MEGPSVHLVADKLQGLIGQEIVEAAGNAREPKEDLVGRRIGDVRAVKKRLFIDTGGVSVVVHFLMYGSYEINQSREDLDERLSLKCSEDEVNFYSCSAKILESNDPEYEEYDDPEVDVLSEKFNAQRALSVISGSDSIIADVLLNQGVFGGVGNIIKNEVLFETEVHPGATARRIPDCKVEEIVDEAFDWSNSWYRRKKSGRDTEFMVYRQRNCEKCKSDIVKEKMGESDRVTFFCPECQKKY